MKNCAGKKKVSIGERGGKFLEVFEQPRTLCTRAGRGHSTFSVSFGLGCGPKNLPFFAFFEPNQLMCDVCTSVLEEKAARVRVCMYIAKCSSGPALCFYFC